MRHLVRGKRLGRDVSHRKATLQALSVALIKEHRIVTTLSKAKELRKHVEPIITRAKEDTSHNRRQVFGKLQDKEAVSHLFEEVAQKALDRPGGYTRIIKAGFRKGDGAEQAVIELVDYNDIKPEQSSSKKRTRRAGKSNKPTSTTETKSKEKEAEEETAKAEDTTNEDPKKQAKQDQEVEDSKGEEKTSADEEE
ncbi:50S ribosomal protein L17 [Aliifodinibius sp. S!AR15-10]|uniref:50S ribosomal protein L17 n=1 Tax=Aliifodinibius sp. S!AR15-10 TaxID=2950437 RepID=UPI002864B825|nr:50S ribosomal protein L17 [Aliifodinibius sp. S!AR15-10]